jgi:hypothetical protein
MFPNSTGSPLWPGVLTARDETSTPTAPRSASALRPNRGTPVAVTASVRITSLWLAALVVVGCTTTHQLERPLTDDEIARLRQPIDGGTVTLLRQDPDPAPRGFEIKRRLPGAIGGLLIGLLAGAATGAGVGIARGDDPPSTWIGQSAGEKAVLGGLVVGVVGGAVGAFVGALVGRTDRYLYAPTAAPAQ